MTLVAADSVSLALDGEPVLGIAEHRLTLTRGLSDRSHADGLGWAEMSALDRPVSLECDVRGTFVSGTAMQRVRNAFLAGSAVLAELGLPGEGAWSGAFLIGTLQLAARGGDELGVRLRLSSTGPVVFMPEQG